jgi:hypothetical protein
MRPLALFLMAISCFAATDPLALRTQQKFDQISNRKVKRGSVVVLTSAELNAWARWKVPESYPQGVRQPAIELGSGTATGSALVDFLKLAQAKGKDVNFLMARLLEGERPLKVWVKLASSGGSATVTLTRVDLSGATIKGSVLEFLIDKVFRPRYPDAKIDQPFDLDFSMDRIDVQPDAVRVFMQK